LEPNADSVFFYNNVIFAKGDTSDWVFKLADVTHLYLENNTIVKDSITAVNVGFICFGGCGSGANWLETPQSPVVIKNTIFADFSSIPFYAGVSATFFDPYSIVQTEVQSSFNLFYDALGQLVVPADSSLNSIVANPLFCDYPSTVYLHQNSPCINSGDPSSPFDPYNTQNDIGAFYFQQNCNLDVFDNQLNELTIYPNPVKDYCTLVSTDELLHEIEIINALGKKVEALQFKQEIQLDFSNFQTGVYFIIDRSNFKRYRIVKI
jgi:hypothetical protein